MKRVLSLLLAFVFTQTQTWALSGGPFGVGSFTSIVGTYSGVLIPVLTTVTGASTSLTANSLGLFTFGAPSTGVATGSIAFFTNGEVFSGDLVGIADPQAGTFRALIDAQTTLRAGTTSSTSSAGATTGSTSTTQNFIGQALGKMEAEASGGGVGGVQRIEGTAHLDLFLGGFQTNGSVAIANSFDFIVDGFQQSSDPSAAGAVGGLGSLGP